MAALIISALLVVTAVPMAAPPSAAAYSSDLTRYPYLTDLVEDVVTINWATTRTLTTGSVSYGPIGDCTARQVVGSRTAITVGTTPQYQWKALLSGLEPSTQYCYRVYSGALDLLGSDPSPIFRSQVAAGASEPYSFAVFGDWGYVDSSGYNALQAELLGRIADSGVRFAITTGDTAYPSGSQASYGDLYQTGANTSAIFGPPYWTVPGRSIPLFNAQGNHGYGNGHSLVNWPTERAVARSGGKYELETYCCTNDTKQASYPSAWYAFTAGTARFYVLTSAWADANLGTADAYKNDYDNHWVTTSPQYQWLKNDLTLSSEPVKFAIWHYPMYADNSTQYSAWLRGAASLEGLLAEHKVSIGFSGHAHIYQRNFRPPGGIITYVTGGGGANPQKIGACTSIDAYGVGWSTSGGKGSACGSAPVPTSPAQVIHYLRVTVHGSAVTVTPVDATGREFDVQTYIFEDEPPSRPLGLVATAVGGTRVDLSWEPSTDNVGVVGYDVYRDGEMIAGVGPVTTYSDMSVQPLTEWVYRVRARDQAGNSSELSAPARVLTPQADTVRSFSPTDDTYIQASSPTKTAGLFTTLQVDASPVKDILLKFQMTGITGTVTGAKLRLYNSDPSPKGGDFALTANADWAERTATWNNAPSAGPVVASLGSVTKGNWHEVDLSSVVMGDGTLSLRVSSQSGDGAGYVSKEGAVDQRPELLVSFAGHDDSNPPSSPQDLSATVTNGGIELVWSASNDDVGVSAYEVERNGASLAFSTTALYADADVAPATTYTYRVRAWDAAGNASAYSEPTTVTTEASPPDAPGNLSAVAGDGEASLRWDAAPFAETYTVMRAVGDEPYEVVVAGLEATTYVDRSLTNGTTYRYVVTAHNQAGDSAYSAPATVTPSPPPAEPPPRALIFSDGFESGTMSAWTSSSGIVVQEAVAHTGLFAAMAETANGNTYAKKTLSTTYDNGYFRTYFNLDPSFQNQVNLMRLRTAADASIAYLFVSAAGRLGLRSDPAGLTVTSKVTVPTGAWNSLELRVAVGGPGVGLSEVWLNGARVSELSLDSISFGTSAIGRVQVGEVQGGRTYTLYFDDVGFDTARIAEAR